MTPRANLASKAHRAFVRGDQVLDTTIREAQTLVRTARSVYRIKNQHSDPITAMRACWLVGQLRHNRRFLIFSLGWFAMAILRKTN